MKDQPLISIRTFWWRCVDRADEKFVSIQPACTCHDDLPDHRSDCETVIVWNECLLEAAKELEAENAAE